MDADGLVVPGVGAFAACMAGLRSVSRATRSSAAGSRAVVRCSASASACRCSSSAGSSTASRPRAATSGPGWSSGCRRPSCRTWAGTPSTCPTGRRCSPASRTSGSTSCTPTASATGRCVTTGRTRAPLVTWAEHGGDRFVAAVENGPLVRDPVPPREVRRRRCPAAAQLGGQWALSEQGARPPPRGARARGGDRPGRAGREAEKRERRTARTRGAHRAGAEAALAPDRDPGRSAGAGRSASPSPWWSRSTCWSGCSCPAGRRAPWCCASACSAPPSCTRCCSRRSERFIHE